MSKVNSDGYINIQGWMVSELGLKGNELLIYAIIYGFSQDGKNKFTGSLQYLADWTNSTKQGVQKVLKSLLEKQLLLKDEKIINNIKFCEYKAIKKVDTVQQSCMGYATEFHEGMQQSCNNNLINNLEDNLDKKIDTSAEAESLDQEKIKFREDINKYILKVAEVTDKNPEEIRRVINPILLKDYDIAIILQKISESNFLSGKLNIKPKINNFCSKTMIDKILIGFYEDHKTKKIQKNIKQKIGKGQYSGEWW